MKEISGYAFRVETDLPFQQAIDRVTDLLKAEGFGILTEIDVQATLRQKLNAEFKPYRILGACNPPFAHRILQTEEHIGVMLPCNVVVWDDGDRRVLAAMEPRLMSQIVDNPEVVNVANEVSQRLRRALAQIEG